MLNSTYILVPLAEGEVFVLSVLDFFKECFGRAVRLQVESSLGIAGRKIGGGSCIETRLI